MVVHPRENDLVIGTHGRGFWILDDYTPLRSVSNDQLQQEATLFPVRDAWWYLPKLTLGDFEVGGKGSQGDAYFVAPNPPFGAVFTYYLKDELKTAEARRQAEEKELAEAGEDTPYPGWDALREEELEEGPAIVLTVTDTGLRDTLSIVAKSWLSVQAALLLAYTTPFSGLVDALRALRVPALIVDIISFMYRYLAVLTDEIRTADEDNPKGYFEDERVKDLEKNEDRSWLRDCRGKVIKIISFLLKDLPDDNRYKVIFMRRNIQEVLASQAKMLERRGEGEGLERGAGLGGGLGRVVERAGLAWRGCHGVDEFARGNGCAGCARRLCAIPPGAAQCRGQTL